MDSRTVPPGSADSLGLIDHSRVANVSEGPWGTDATRAQCDALPFDGRKKAGFGREGVRDTMLEMTEQKLVSLNLGD